MKLAGSLARLGTETAFAVAAAAAAWAARGSRVYPFHLGDVNLPPPPEVVDAAMRAVAAGKNGYCPGAGAPLFREQLARVLSEERGVNFSPSQVAAQPGGKPVIGKFLAAVLEPGDEVLYPVPGFPIYQSQINWQGGAAIPYFYRRDGAGNFAPDLEQMRAAITKKTRALIYNNHHNPTGASAGEEELQAVAKLAREHDLWVLADEAYYHIRYDNAPPRSVLPLEDMTERAVMLFTCSKQYAMTGWRLGAAVGPENIIAAIAKMNTNWESCTTHFIQCAVGEVMKSGGTDISPMMNTLRARRDALTAGLAAIDGVVVAAPPSGFYVYADFGEVMKRRGAATMEALMNDALHETGAAFCTGAHFGEDAAATPHARFAFSGIAQEDIEEGVAKLKVFFESAG